MREFIESFAGDAKLDFKYAKYNSLFIKRDYNSYYLFFFLKEKGELLELKRKTEDIFLAIKENSELYQPDMEKNITCVLCLCVEENEYYYSEANREISDLSKVICFVEEDLNFFKKNVLLYTNKMEAFARSNIGRFESVCEKYFTEENFQKYKKSNRNMIEYDFLINLFIKIPFLSFCKYQENNEKYQTIRAFIEEKIKKMEIDYDEISRISQQLEENLEDENKLCNWLDTLIKMHTEENKFLKEITEDEN